MIKRITVITGHYGSGKSTFAANYAIAAAAEGRKDVAVCDMDTVNPYFRTADLRDIFSENGVRLIAPMYAGTNLDTPILDYDIPSLYEEGLSMVIDMGGDDTGAYPLGKFGDFLKSHGQETDVLYVVNFRRYLTRDPADSAEIMRDIEKACGLGITGIVNNTNLGAETDRDIISEGAALAEELSRISGVPVFCNTVPTLCCRDVKVDKMFHVERLIADPFSK